MAERHTPPPLLSAPLSIWLRPYHQAPSSDGAFFSPHRTNLSPPCRSAYLLDRMSLCLMHGCYVAKCIADQKVKTYIGFVAGEAAPYPPPSDPLLATPDRIRILLPRRRSTGLVQILLPCTRTITCDLASALSSGSNFGWSLFFCPLGHRAVMPSPYESAWQHFQLRVCAEGAHIR